MRRWLLASLFWVFIGALYAAQIVYMSRMPGERINVQAALIWNVSYYLCWIPFTPLIWSISRNWTPVALRAAALLGRHLLLAVVVTFLHTVICVLLAGWLMPQYMNWTMFFGQLRGRMVSGLLVYVAIAGAGMALSYYARWREQQVASAHLQAQLSEARLDSLKAQLHPHFLFNSLHTVASLIRTGDSAGAIRTVAGLSDLLRRVLDSDARSTVPLSEEAGFLEKYFEIQRVRFGDRLLTSIDLQPGTEQLEIPAMLLQPLVENSFRHGLADRIEAGHIAVRASRAGDRLTLTVEDDGEGLPSGWTRASRGVGLTTTEARLQQMYPGRYDFRVEPREGGGTIATIRLPA